MIAVRDEEGISMDYVHNDTHERHNMNKQFYINNFYLLSKLVVIAMSSLGT